MVVARWAKSRGEAGGHKARPYAQRFPFNFEVAHGYEPPRSAQLFAAMPKSTR
jgi:hypothetical protein